MKPKSSPRSKISATRESGENKRGFPCELCDKSFAQKAYVMKHTILVHHGQWPYVCELCPKSFCNATSLTDHIKSVHQGVRFECSSCKKWFSLKSTLQNHIRTIHSTAPRKRFPCELCSKTFISKAACQNHVSTFHLGQRPYPCKFCSKSFGEKSNLSCHMKACHYGIKHSCEICGKLLSSKGNLNLHIRAIHKNPPRLPCPYCTRSFLHLNQHINIAHKAEFGEFKCNQCSKSFTRELYVKLHIKRMHANKDKTHKCTICNKAFYTKHERGLHSRVHLPQKNSFKCEQCGRMLASRGNLLEHIKYVHGSSGRATCIFCDQVLPYKNLNNHLLGHINERSFECNLCARVFKTKTIRDAHLRTHTGEKPHACVICSKKFPSKHSLFNHRATHLEVKPHNCIFCGNEFTTKMELHYHILRKVREHSCWCNVCDRGFIGQVFLKVHKLSHEPGKYKCKLCNQVCKSSFSLRRHNRRRHNEWISKLTVINVCMLSQFSFYILFGFHYYY